MTPRSAYGPGLGIVFLVFLLPQWCRLPAKVVTAARLLPLASLRVASLRHLLRLSLHPSGLLAQTLTRTTPSGRLDDGDWNGLALPS